MLTHDPVRLSDQELEDLIADDLPVLDLTSHLLGLGGQPAELCYRARHQTVVCGAEEGARILAKLGLEAREAASSGVRLEQGATILRALGPLGAVHQAWRLVGSLLEHASGMATRTRLLVEAARAVNPGIAVLTTRKFFPGSKRLSIKAILAGGALPHRLGLSETVLVFDEHIRLAGGMGAFLSSLPVLRLAAGGKTIGVEVHNPADALAVAKAGADVVQLDKFAPELAAQVVAQLRQETPRVRVALAGGINADNAGAHAASGAHMLVTTWPYFGKPADIEAVIGPPPPGA